MPWQFNPFTGNLDWTDAGAHTQNTDTALGAQSENLDMNTHKIVGVVDPTANQEAATKKYVDDNIGGVSLSEVLTWGTL